MENHREKAPSLSPSISLKQSSIIDDQELYLYKIQKDQPQSTCCCLKLKSLIKLYALFHLIWTAFQVILYIKSDERDKFAIIIEKINIGQNFDDTDINFKT